MFVLSRFIFLIFSDPEPAEWYKPSPSKWFQILLQASSQRDICATSPVGGTMKASWPDAQTKQLISMQKSSQKSELFTLSL